MKWIGCLPGILGAYDILTTPVLAQTQLCNFCVQNVNVSISAKRLFTYRCVKAGCTNSTTSDKTSEHHDCQSVLLSVNPEQTEGQQNVI